MVKTLGNTINNSHTGWAWKKLTGNQFSCEANLLIELLHLITKWIKALRWSLQFLDFTLSFLWNNSSDFAQCTGTPTPALRWWLLLFPCTSVLVVLLAWNHKWKQTNHQPVAASKFVLLRVLLLYTNIPFFKWSSLTTRLWLTWSFGYLS